jgi:hypothetical protein
MLRRGRYCLSATVPAGSLAACLPREEERLSVHAGRILRDCDLRLRERAVVAAGDSRHDLVVSEATWDCDCVLRPASPQARLLGTCTSTVGCANTLTNGTVEKPVPTPGLPNQLTKSASYTQIRLSTKKPIHLHPRPAASVLQRAAVDTLQLCRSGPLTTISRDHPKLHHIHKTAITADAQLLRLAVKRARPDIVFHAPATIFATSTPSTITQTSVVTDANVSPSPIQPCLRANGGVHTLLTIREHACASFSSVAKLSRPVSTSDSVSCHARIRFAGSVDMIVVFSFPSLECVMTSRLMDSCAS